MKIKVVKSMMLHASSDILASLEESCFQTRKCYLQHEYWSIMTLKIWSISAKHWSKNLRTLLLNKTKSTKRTERKAESNNNILLDKLWVFVFFCVAFYHNDAKFVAFSLICLESLRYIQFFDCFVWQFDVSAKVQNSLR